VDLKSINKRIVDRNNIFYWQAERKISEEESGEIWKDRHYAINNSELIKVVNSCLVNDECISIDEVDPNKQESNGSVNSNRVGHLRSGKDVIIRCHPRGIENGYFYVESLVAKLLLENGLPSYHTYAIHDCENKDDCAFQIIEKIDGTVVEWFLRDNPEQEKKIVFEIGKTMAQIHKIKVDGFGPFDNNLAKKGVLKGLHNSFYDSVVAGLDFDLETLVRHEVISKEKANGFKKLFSKDNPLLKCEQAVLVHNDFADWNMLTDGKKINGKIDLDECVASDSVTDIACWSLFFKPERLNNFLDGYFSVAQKPADFEDKFQLLRLRYSLSKMTLRTRRYTYEKSDFMKKMIENGKGHLNDSAKYFGVSK